MLLKCNWQQHFQHHHPIALLLKKCSRVVVITGLPRMSADRWVTLGVGVWEDASISQFFLFCLCCQFFSPGSLVIRLPLQAPGRGRVLLLLLLIFCSVTGSVCPGFAGALVPLLVLGSGQVRASANGHFNWTYARSSRGWFCRVCK